MKEILLNHNKITLVDDEDYDRVMQYKWYAHNASIGCMWYAIRIIRIKNEYWNKKYIAMHRFILNLDDSEKRQVDHKDRNGLNNQKHNLRLATNNQNQANRPKPYGESKYKGVTKERSTGKWVARIRINGKKTHLGTFLTEEDAGKAYDIAAKQIFSEFAYLNFPNE